MADDDSKVVIGISYDSKAGKEWNRKFTNDMKNVSKVANKSANDSKKSNKAAEKEAKDQGKKINAARKEENKLLSEKLSLIERINRATGKQQQLDKKTGAGGRGIGGGGQPPSKAADRDRERDDKRKSSDLADALKKAVMFAGGTLVGAGIAYAMRGYTEKTALYKDLSQVAFMGQKQFGGSRRAAEERFMQGERYGYSARETLGQAAQMGRATGGIGLLNLAQAQSRERGIDIGEIIGLGGAMTRGGMNVNTAGGKRAVTKIFEDATRSGLDNSRTGEHLDAVSSLMQAGMGASAGIVPTNMISSMLASLGEKLGPAFQGERGAATLAKFDQAIKGGGGSEASRAWMQQAFGFGRPGGGASFGEVTRRMQRGILGGEGDQGAQNFIDMLKYAQQTTGSPEETSYLLSQMTGETMDRIDKLMTAYSGPGGLEALKEAITAEKDRGKSDLEKLTTAVQDFTKTARFDVTELNQRMRGITEESLNNMNKIQEHINDMLVKMDTLFNDLTGALVRLTPAIDTLSEGVGKVVNILHNFSVGAMHGIDTLTGNTDDDVLRRAGEASRVPLYGHGAASQGGDFTPVPGMPGVFTRDAETAKAIQEGRLGPDSTPREQMSPAQRMNQGIYDEFARTHQAKVEELLGQVVANTTPARGTVTIGPIEVIPPGTAVNTPSVNGRNGR